jgi:hypothetical protein
MFLVLDLASYLHHTFLTDKFTYFFVKVKHSHYTPMEERKYSSYSFMTSAVDGDEWSVSRPGCTLPLGKRPPVPIGQEAGWAPEAVWTQRLEEKSICLCRGWNLDHPVIQSVVRHCTN